MLLQHHCERQTPGCPWSLSPGTRVLQCGWNSGFPLTHRIWRRWWNVTPGVLLYETHLASKLTLETLCWLDRARGYGGGAMWQNMAVVPRTWGGFQKLRADSSQSPAKYFSSQSCNHKEPNAANNHEWNSKPTPSWTSKCRPGPGQHKQEPS